VVHEVALVQGLSENFIFPVPVHSSGVQ
jgi:hypothetical protein